MRDNRSQASLARRVALIPAGLLVIVYLCQVALTQTHDLLPSKGGGFGMYSTPDHRFFEFEVTDSDSKTYRGDHKSFYASHWRLYQRTMMMPSEELLCAVASAWRESTLRRVPITDSMLGPSAQAARGWLESDEEWGAGLTLVDPSESVVTSDDTHPRAPIVTPASIRVRIWQTRFSAATGALHREPLGQGIEWKRGRCEALP